MDFQCYLGEFERILNTPAPPSPYDSPDYLGYTKLNWARLNRWLIKGKLTEQLMVVVKRISQPQQWIVITEPWCGDAAHTVPFIHLAAQLNPLIMVDYELRDAPPFRINDYLSNGSKSIPKLIIRDSTGKDLATWGPRPLGCQILFDRLKATGTDYEAQKTALQKWYNEDKGESLQMELGVILARIGGATSLTRSHVAVHPGILQR